MPAEVRPGTGPAPRRAAYLIPRQFPRRGELVAACVVALLLVHLVFAQLTFVLAVIFAVISKVSRWRLSWLAVPAVAGVIATLVTGPAAAAAGFAAGPAQILGYLGAHGLLHVDGAVSGAFRGAFASSGAGGWLPRQFPIALIAASAEAAVAGWLDWLHTDEWAVPPSRPGLAAAARRAVTIRSIRGGAVVTRNGATLGVVPETGARAALSWDEIRAGVLLTGAAGRDIASTGFQVVHAALRLRKPVIVVDLTGDPAMGSALATACSAAGTPLRTFGVRDGSYEPFRGADPGRRTELALALLGADARGAEPCLRTAFELMTAVPADAQTPVLDDAAHLLNPVAAHARLRLVPPDGELAGRLAGRVEAAARLAQAEPERVAAVARQLAEIRGSQAGAWLRPGSAGHPDIDLAQVVRNRSAALFRPDSQAMARLVVADLLALGDDLRRLEVDGDAVVVLCGCEKLPAAAVTGLVDSGATAGLPVLATTTSAPAAAGLAGAFGTVVIHRLAAADARVDSEGPASAAAVLAGCTGTRLVPPSVAAAEAGPSGLGGAGGVPVPLSAAFEPPATGTIGLVPQPAVPVRDLLSLGTAQFTIAVTEPRPRLVPLGQTVPARLPRPAEAGAASASASRETRAIARLRASITRSPAPSPAAPSPVAPPAPPQAAPEAAPRALDAPAPPEGVL